jgi:hypothetical protein
MAAGLSAFGSVERRRCPITRSMNGHNHPEHEICRLRQARPTWHPPMK